MSRYHRSVGVAAPTGTMRRSSRPAEAPQLVDRETLKEKGARAERRHVTPLRFFPRDFPIPSSLIGVITILAAVAVIVGLFWQMRTVLSPFVLILVAAILLYPFRREPRLRPLILITILIFLIWLLTTAFQVFVPFAAAFLLAYVVDPLVTMLQRKFYVRRWISALVAALFLVGLIVVVAVYVFPILFTQIGAAIGAISEISASLIHWARDGGLAQLTGIPPEKAVLIVDRYLAPRLSGIEAAAFQRASEMTEDLPGTLPNILAIVSNFLMVPFLTFYLVKDYWRIRAAAYSYIPQTYQVRSQKFLNDLHEVVGGFLRGDLITSIFQGLMIGVGLQVIGVPGALLLGVITGVLALIPYIGGFIAYAIALITALSLPDPSMAALYVTILFIAQSIVETTLIGPQVMGRHTDLHPLVVMISLLLFGYFMGMIGMLIAIPAVGLLVRWAQRWRDRRRAQIEAQKVNEDIEINPHHARRGGSPPLVPGGRMGSAASAPSGSPGIGGG